MAQVWFRRAGAGTSGLNNGTSRANAYQGIKKLDDVLRAGSISVSDTLTFDETSGPLDLTDRGQFAANPNSQATGFNFDTQMFNTGCGIQLGTGMGSTSYMSGRTINWNGSWTNPSLDMRNIASNAQRMMAGIRIFGESITVNDFYGHAPDWPYLRTSANPSNVPGTSSSQDAETISDENVCLLVGGNGNKVLNFYTDGGAGTRNWCLVGMMYMLSNINVAGDSNNLSGEIVGRTKRSFSGIDVVEYGGTATHGIAKNTFVDVHDCVVESCVWGVNPGMTIRGYNGSRHGNGFRARGILRGGCLFRDSEVTGEFQDGAVNLAYANTFRDLYIHDIGPAVNTYWQWNATSGLHELVTTAFAGEGNGLKLGLGNYDMGGPSTWLGDDGTFGGTGSQQFKVDEVRAIVLRCKVQNVTGAGITSNNSRGCAIISCEVWDSGSHGIICTIGSSGNVANYWLQNTLVRKFATDPNNFAMYVGPRARMHMYNNVLWSNPSISTQRDISWDSVFTPIKDKNLLVTGRTSGGVTYPTTGDLTNTGDRAFAGMSSGYTFGSGFAAGHSCKTAGTSTPFNASRTVGSRMGADRVAFPTTTPPIGPYN